MTPQLQQAIRLLALSNLEIDSFIAEELERNRCSTAARATTRAEPSRDGAAESDGAATTTSCVGDALGCAARRRLRQRDFHQDSADRCAG
jgi:RNA polymerase sigma-54 factor